MNSEQQFALIKKENAAKINCINVFHFHFYNIAHIILYLS